MFEDWLGGIEIEWNYALPTLVFWALCIYGLFKAQTLIGTGEIMWFENIVAAIVLLPMFYFTIKYVAEK